MALSDEMQPREKKEAMKKGEDILVNLDALTRCTHFNFSLKGFTRCSQFFFLTDQRLMPNLNLLLKLKLKETLSNG